MSLRELKSLYDRNNRNELGNPVGQNPPSAGNYFTDKGAVDSPFVTRGGGTDHMINLLTTNIYSLNSEQSYLPAPNQSDFQDLDGQPGPQLQLGRAAASQKHIDSLTKQSTYTYGNSTEVVGPTPGGDSNSPYQDLDAIDGGQGYFHGLANPGHYQGKKIGGIDLHEHLLTKHYQYTHGDAPTVTILQGKDSSGGQYDLDGVVKNGYFAGLNNPGKGRGFQIEGLDLHEHLLTKGVVFGKEPKQYTIGPSPGPSGFSEFQDLNGMGKNIINSELGQWGGPYKSTGPVDGRY